MSLSRRTLLRGAGGLAFALPLLSAFKARGADAVFPRRFIVYYHPNGVLPSGWYPAAGASETDFTLSAALQPLEPLREHVLITRGLELKCGTIGPGEPHQKGMGGVLTGWHLNQGTMVGGDGSTAGWAKGISLDQRLAQHLGADTRFGSLLLGVRPRGGDVRHHLSYAGENLPLPVIADPTTAWTKLFSDFGGSDPELARIRLRRGSVLDGVREQLALLRRDLPASDRAQLDRHEDLVRDLEMRLGATTSGSSCQKPPEPPQLEPDSAATMQDIARLHIDLLVMAMACDLTRVGMVQMGQADNHLTFPWLQSDLDGHTLSHLGNTDPAKPQVEWRDHWFAEQFAYLLTKLQAIPEGDGTMLDHTQVLWVNELGVGNTHSQKEMPFVLAGHAAGFRMGRYVQWADASHSDLLLSLLHGFGANDATFGNPTFVQGDLPNLL